MRSWGYRLVLKSYFPSAFRQCCFTFVSLGTKKGLRRLFSLLGACPWPNWGCRQKLASTAEPARGLSAVDRSCSLSRESSIAYLVREFHRRLIPFSMVAAYLRPFAAFLLQSGLRRKPCSPPW